jgi:hypothetical protein
MVIDQRNNGASVVPNSFGIYTLDRWRAWEDTDGTATVQQSSVVPTGFTKSLLYTTTSADSSLASGQYTCVGQFIEGFNTADLAWGTANAKTVTLSFWVRSSLTGTFGGSFANDAANRSYPFSYTISTANTFEYKTITIAGDTTGTWETTNNSGIKIYFGLGVGSTYSGTAGAWSGSLLFSATGATSVVGTNGATWYVTGVQLERNTTATPFEWIPYGTELQLCQRYYYKVTGDNYGSAFCDSTTGALGSTSFQVQMRIAPTALETSGTAAHYAIRRSAGTNTTCNAVPTFNTATPFVGESVFSVASGLTAGQGVIFRSLSSSSYLAWSAEL